MIEGCKDLAKVHGTISNFSAKTICGSDHLAGSQSSSSEKGPTDSRPVVTTCVPIDFRSSSKFTPGHDERVVEHASIVEVFDQSAEPLVKHRGMRTHSCEIVAVEIPATEIQSHAASAGFDKASSEEEMLQVPRCTVTKILRVTFSVTLANFRIFVFQIQRLRQLA